MRHQSPWFLVVFGLVVAFLLAGIAFWVVSSLHQESNVPPVVVTSPESVLADYRVAMQELRVSIDTTELKNIGSAVEEVMLRVRVPAQLLDDHLSALLSVKKAIDESTMRSDVQHILDALIEKANAV